MGDFNFQDAASNGTGQFIVTGDHGAMLVCNLASRDGKYTMTAVPRVFNPDGSGIHMLKYANGKYFIGTFSGGLYSSVNGLDWTGHVAMPAPINDIVFGDGYYYAACDDGIYRSSDSKAWARVYQSDSKLLSIAKGGGRIVACGEDGTIVCSGKANGLAIWIEAGGELSDESGYETYYSVAFGNNAWMIGGGTGWGGHGAMLRSTDGINWAEVHAESESGDWDIIYSNCSYAIEYIGDGFVSAGLNRGRDSEIMKSSADGAEWEVTSSVYHWGLDLFEPLKGVAAVITNCDIYIDGAHFSTYDVRLSPNDYAKIAPANSIKPMFDKAEEISASDKV
jgi:hypothetical protein